MDAIRQAARKTRAAIPAEHRAALSARIQTAVLEDPAWLSARVIFCYAAVGTEADTGTLLRAALRQGKILALPRCLAEGQMEAVRVETVDILETLRPGRFGIPEPTGMKISPETIDLMIVPGLLFDRAGRRIGYGGGYYDRFAAGCPAFRMGLCFPEQLRADLPPPEPWDAAMDALALPEGVWTIQGNKY
jgi:5-formyltetrahydrofolate cyclo-ligase